MSGLKKLSEFDPLTSVSDNVQFYAIIDGKTVRVTKAQLLASERSSNSSVARQIRDEVANATAQLRTQVTNLTSKVNSNKAITDEQWAQSIRAGYGTSFGYSGSIQNASIQRNLTDTYLINTGGKADTFSQCKFHLNFPTYRVTSWKDSAHTQKQTKTYTMFLDPNTQGGINAVPLFVIWREYYNGAWTSYNYSMFRDDDMAGLKCGSTGQGTNGVITIPLPHALFNVQISSNGLDVTWRRWKNSTYVTAIEYQIGLINRGDCCQNFRPGYPGNNFLIDQTANDKHAAAWSSSNLRW